MPGLGLALWALLALVPALALAAQRHCGEAIVTEAIDRSEAEARRAALEHWVNEARIHGEAFAAWRLATDRSITCAPTAAQIHCTVRARPCGISHVPGQAPPWIPPAAREAPRQ